jgi:hypothetical protein
LRGYGRRISRFIGPFKDLYPIVHAVVTHSLMEDDPDRAPETEEEKTAYVLSAPSSALTSFLGVWPTRPSCAMSATSSLASAPT